MSISAVQNAMYNATSALTSNVTSNVSSSSSTSSSIGTVSITANDFLTLLTTELKNQDPTSTQDPNQYIDQLTQINSLEQLIQINSGVSSFDSAIGANPTSSKIAGPVANIASASSTNNVSTDKAAAIANALARGR